MDKTVTDDFYEKVIAKLQTAGEFSQQSSVLVVAGGKRDRDAWLSKGCTEVTISNLDNRMVGNEFAPFHWSFQDAEKLTFPDASFDYVAIHNGLHHCYCPQNAILEMLRVSRKGVLLYEPYDNFVTRLGCMLGVGQDYETAAVFYNGGTHGGVRNGAVANYIYRFTRREIIKTVATARPAYPPHVRFFHELRVPWVQLKGRKNQLPYWLAIAAIPVIKVVAAIMPTQTNCFAAFIAKTDRETECWPWVRKGENGELTSNMEWMTQRYHP